MPNKIHFLRRAKFQYISNAAQLELERKLYILELSEEQNECLLQPNLGLFDLPENSFLTKGQVSIYFNADIEGKLYIWELSEEQNDSF